MVIAMNNVVGGGDNWVCDSSGAPVTHVLSECGYVPYIECADNVEPPSYTSMKFNGSVCTIVTSSVTTAQMGGSGGTACKLRLRIIK